MNFAGQLREIAVLRQEHSMVPGAQGWAFAVLLRKGTEREQEAAEAHLRGSSRGLAWAWREGCSQAFEPALVQRERSAIGRVPT